jgi:hypothetical protein
MPRRDDGWRLSRRQTYSGGVGSSPDSPSRLNRPPHTLTVRGIVSTARAIDRVSRGANPGVRATILSSSHLRPSGHENRHHLRRGNRLRRRRVEFLDFKHPNVHFHFTPTRASWLNRWRSGSRSCKESPARRLHHVGQAGHRCLHRSI